MNKTIKPHFVPASYLHFWDIQGNPSGRKSKIYVSDTLQSDERSISKSAIIKNFYSKSDPNDAEEYFQGFEGKWSHLVKQFLVGIIPDPKIFGSIALMQCAHLLVRNRSFENHSSSERIKLFKQSVETFYNQKILNNESLNSVNDNADVVNKNWHILIFNSSDKNFITSDNPVLTLNTAENYPALIYLPIHPKWSIMAIKKNTFNINRVKLTDKDIDSLNKYMIMNCNREVYSTIPLDDQNLDLLKNWMIAKPKKKQNWFDDEFFRLESYNYPLFGLKFSFIE